jgi:hypothetical protein
VLIRSLLAAGAVLLAATAVHLLNFAATGGSFRFLDSGWVLSYSHVLATLGYAAGLVAGATGFRSHGTNRRTWGLLAATSGVLLVDHVTRAHDATGFGVIVAAPLAVLLAVLSLRIARRSDRAGVVVAGVVALAAALVVHLVLRRLAAVTPWEPHGYNFEWWFQVAVALKEGLELAGWVLLAPALLVMAGVRLPRLRVTKTTG